MRRKLVGLAGSLVLLVIPVAPAAAEGPIPRDAVTASLQSVRPRFEQTLVFESQGVIECKLGKRERDRTLTMVPIIQGGHVERLDVVVVDHIDDERTFNGRLRVAPHGAVSAEAPDMVNTANIFGVTPSVLTQLRQGVRSVVTEGQTEISGDLKAVRFTHELVGPADARPQRVRTRTSSADGKFALETVTTLGQDGLPTHAITRGTVEAFATLTVNLTLRRVESPARSE